MRVTRLRLAVVLSILCLLLIPTFSGSYVVHMLIMIFSFGYLSIAWNIIGGFAGQLSLGHALFFGIGAYSSTLLFMKLGISPWIGMVFGGVFSTIIALPVGLIMFKYKLRGAFFAIATLSFAEIFRIVVGEVRFFGGSEGLLIPLMGSSFWMFQFESKVPYYYISLCMMLGMFWISYLIRRSKYFLFLFSVKADEDAANAVGVHINRYKTMAFMMSAFFTAFNGTFFAQYYKFIEPETVCSVGVSVDILMRPIIGGLGTVFGPLFGSFLMTPLSEIIRSIVGTGMSGVHLLVYGVALIAICIWMPEGILPYLGRRLKRG